jgi:hypothetical protein
MLNFVENFLENERGPMNDQDLTKTDYDPDSSLVLIEGLSHFLQNLASCQTSLSHLWLILHVTDSGFLPTYQTSRQKLTRLGPIMADPCGDHFMHFITTATAPSSPSLFKKFVMVIYYLM